MNKPFLTFSLCVAMDILSSSAVVTIEGNETEYASISEAMAAAESGATILVSESYAESTNINPGAKTITIKGTSENVVVSFGGQYVVTLNSADASLSIENLTFKNTLSAANPRHTFAISNGRLFLTDVVIDGSNVRPSERTDTQTGAVTRTPQYVISLGGNVKEAVFDNVRIINSHAEDALAEVDVNNNNLVLKGDTRMSIYLERNNSIKNAEGFDGDVTLVFADTRQAGSIVVNNCTDPSHFTLEGKEDHTLLTENGNLVYAEKPVVLNQTTNKGYETLAAAVNDAESGATLVLNQDVTIVRSTRPDLGGKKLAIKGASGEEKIIRGADFTLYLFTIGAAGQTPAPDLTLENLTIDGNNIDIKNNAMLQPGFGASLTLRNVSVVNCVASTCTRALIDNNNNNPGTWHLDGVSFTDCEVPNQLVAANSDGNTISGNNNLTLRIYNSKTVGAEGVDNTTPVSVTINGDVQEGATVFTGCTNANQFICANNGYVFQPGTDNNLILGRKIISGVDGISADTEEEAIWFDLRGERVNPVAPGLYIVRKGSNVSKVYVR